MAGSVIDNYEIVAELGRGGMGVVYKALDRSLHREVAIKVLSPHLAGDPQFVDRFLREARAAAQLSHPNIAHVYAVGESSGHRYIVMEYIKGQTLAHWIRTQGALESSRALSIVREVADALSTAHSAGIVHRDIKPANIMIDGAGHVKVMDFGLAKLASATAGVTASGAILGTPQYMAPEQVQAREVDGRADIYSLGITLYEMLAGEPPFNADTPIGLMYQIVHEPLPDLGRLLPIPPLAVRHILAKMTAKKPEERYSTSEMVFSDLSDLERDALRDTKKHAGPATAVRIKGGMLSSFNRWIGAIVFLCIFLASIVSFVIAKGGHTSLASRASPDSPNDQGFDLVAGRWQWFTGVRLIISRDGSVTMESAGTVSVEDAKQRIFRTVSSTGSYDNAEVLSEDGTRLCIRRQDGSTFVRERIGPPPASRADHVDLNSIVGEWRGMDNGIVRFNEDGSYLWRHEKRGKVNILDAREGRFVIQWVTGNIDMLRLNTEGDKLEGKNDKGDNVWGVRQGQ